MVVLTVSARDTGADRGLLGDGGDKVPPNWLEPNSPGTIGELAGFCRD